MNLRLITLLLTFLSAAVYAQDNFLPSIRVKIVDKTFIFQCEGVLNSSQVTVRAAESPGDRPILTYQLDEFDDCSQTTWETDTFGSERASKLVMVNPGRFGLNSKIPTFLISKGIVSFAGYIPIDAERVSNSEYRSYSSDADGFWERIDELIHGKFVVSRELQLMRSGSLCIDNFGSVLNQAPCKSRRIYARQDKPICIEYRAREGKRTSVATCSRLLRNGIDE